MQGMADVYNQFHNFSGGNISRKILNSKRLASGFFLYSFLEMTARCNIWPKMHTDKNWLDGSILNNLTSLKTVFSNVWCAPQDCKADNCEGMRISDCGMIIHSTVCAAKFSVVRKYQHSDKTVLTGCTAMPSSDNPFCKEHMEAEMPVILSNRVTTQTRNKLWTYRQKSQGYGLKLPNASIFTVESVLNARKNKNKIEFLVKFAGFPFQEACWEPVTSLPTFIVEHYSVITNLGTPLPTPTVKKTVKNGSGTEIFQHLEWKTSGLDSEALKLRDGESLFDIDQDKLEQDEILSTCNTRKVRDKRDRRHTAGILISATPCGRIPHVDELFGCETIQQVHGSIIEFLGNLNPENRAKFRVWLFNDIVSSKTSLRKIPGCKLQ